MRESQIEKEVCAWAKIHGIQAVKFTPMGEVGWPDRIFLKDGKAIFIEFKRSGQLARPLQQHRLNVLVTNGFKAEVHDNVQTAIEFLRSSLLSGSGN